MRSRESSTTPGRTFPSRASIAANAPNCAARTTASCRSSSRPYRPRNSKPGWTSRKRRRRPLRRPPQRRLRSRLLPLRRRTAEQHSFEKCGQDDRVVIHAIRTMAKTQVPTMANTAAHADDHAHDDHDHKPEGFLDRWLFTTNHKDIGTLYLVFAFTMATIGAAMS